jgi:hypothetical protein
MTQQQQAQGWGQAPAPIEPKIRKYSPFAGRVAFGIYGLVLGIGAVGLAGEEPAPASSAAPAPAPTVTVTNAAAPAPTVTVTAQGREPNPTKTVRVTVTAKPPKPSGTFTDGTFLVGSEIKAGTYRTSNPDGSCYWERLSGTSGDFEDIIANGNPDGQAVVTIRSSDEAFNSQMCGEWTPVR